MSNLLLMLMLLFAIGGTFMRAFFIWREPIQPVLVTIALYIIVYFVINKFFNTDVFNKFVQKLYHPKRLAILCIIFLIITMSASRFTFRRQFDECRYMGFVKKTADKNVNFITSYYNERQDFHGQVAPLILLAHVWIEKAGITGYPAHRVLNNVFGLLLLVILYRLAQLMWDKKIAFLSAVTLVSFNSFLVHSISIMLAMPLSLFFLISIFFFFRLQETGKTKYCYYTAFFAALAFYSKYIGILFAPIALCISAISKKPSMKHTFVTLIIFSLLVSLWSICRIEYKTHDIRHDNNIEQKNLIGEATIQSLRYYGARIKARLYRTFRGTLGNYAPGRSDWFKFFIQFPFLLNAHNLVLLLFLIKNSLYNLKNQKTTLLFIPVLFTLVTFLIIDPRPRYFISILPFVALLIVVNLKEKMPRDYAKILLMAWSFSVIYYFYSFTAHKV